MGEKNILLKVHKSYRWVVAVCDKELYGNKFVEDKKQLDLTGEFFHGDEMNCDEVKNEIERCALEDATFNIVGENSVRIAKEMGVVVDGGVSEIKGIPFALVLV